MALFVHVYNNYDFILKLNIDLEAITNINKKNTEIILHYLYDNYYYVLVLSNYFVCIGNLFYDVSVQDFVYDKHLLII